jgi:signal transduction histidine kinase
VIARRLVVAAVLALCTMPIRAAADDAARVRTVVAIHLGAPDFPTNPVLNAAIRETLASRASSPLDYNVEYLESEHFDIADASRALVESIRLKYAHRHIDIVLAMTDPVLQFVLDHRASLFPDAAIVYAGLATPDERVRTAGRGLTGVLVGGAYNETLRLALQLHPATDHVFVVAKSPDAHNVGSAHAQLQPFASRVRITYLEQDTVSALINAIGQVPRRSLVLFLWYTQDEPGDVMSSHEIARLVAARSAVPMYGTNEFYVGTGIIGGVMRRTHETGTRVAEMALEILDGVNAADIQIEPARLVPVFDSRHLLRWDIDESRLPPDSVVEFREPSLWRDYRKTTLSAIAVGIVQFGLIVGLVYERRARHRAELRTRHHLAISAHMERLLAMGELAAAMAHELNQPLGAILHNAAAADLLLASKRAPIDELRQILADIQREDTRAAQIIQRQRRMLQKRELEPRNLDLNGTVRESLEIVAHHALSHQVRIESELCDEPCRIDGDPILLQQVLVNLVLNAIDAMATVPAAVRHVVIRTRTTGTTAEIAVRDCGTGIAPDVATRLFQPFVSTKMAGMGIGLTIVRGIVEAHGGTIDGHNNPDGGATFWFTLPCAVQTVSRSA